MAIRIVPTAEEYVEGFHRAVDVVARERRYIAMVEAPPLESTRAFVRSFLAGAGVQMLALADDDTVVGWCDIVRNPREGFTHCGHLGMGLLPHVRGLGLGEQLARATIDRAWEWGLERIELEVFASNEPAIGLYRKLGFATEGVKQRARKLDGEYDDNVFMALMRQDGLPPQTLLPSLTTARLDLRALELADAEDVFEYARDPQVLRYTTGTTPAHVDETLAFVRGALASLDDRMWAIRLREQPTVVGVIEFGMSTPTSGTIHYALGAAHWGRGFMTEAVNAVCEWAFERFPALAGIATSVAEANVGSARVLAKCGFMRIGTTVEKWDKHDEPVTLVLFHRVRR